MRLLVLGGTSFVGRHLVAEAISRGHDVTVLHRGKTSANGLEGVAEILGDRKEGLHGAENQTWDAVVDSSGYLPGVVGMSARLLANRCSRYLFISTISVYANPIVPTDREGGALATVADPTTEVINGETYGGLKVLCENEVTQAFGERATILRPGIIAGPNDPTARYPYWPWRQSQGGEYLAGWNPEQSIEMIDTRDLGAFAVSLLEQDHPGTYDVTGESITFGDLHEASRLGHDSTPVWVTRDFLEQQEIKPWVDLPLLLEDDAQSIMQITSEAALANGLTRRPYVETARDTLAWIQSLSPDQFPKFNFTPERETVALAAWCVKG